MRSYQVSGKLGACQTPHARGDSALAQSHWDSAIDTRRALLHVRQIDVERIEIQSLLNEGNAHAPQTG